MNKNLLLIDMQTDLCDVLGNCYVSQSEPIIKRFASDLFKFCIDTKDISHFPNLMVALKTREYVHLYHSAFWREHPPIGTIITLDDVVKGRWLPIDITTDEDVKEYLNIIEEEQFAPLCISSPHCVIGTAGHALHREVAITIRTLETKMNNSCITFFHGLRPLETYRQDPDSVFSGVSGMEQDPLLDAASICDSIIESDLTGLCGMALTTTVASTLLDLQSMAIDMDSVVLIEEACPILESSDNDVKSLKEHMKSYGIKNMTLKEFLSVE
jgi:nicotinamidase-related amidase